MELLPHQKKAVKFAMENPYSILAVDPGGGKSFISLYVSNEIKKNTLIICPAYLTLNWGNEIKKFYPDLEFEVFRFKSDIMAPKSRVVVSTYETAQQSPDLFKWAKIVIFDEAHYLKNMETKRTEIFHKYIYENSVSRLMLLTGTPILNRVDEFYSLMSLCNYNPRLETSEFLSKFDNQFTFANTFSYKKEYKSKVFSKARRRMVEIPIVKYFGIRNTDLLKKYLKGIYIRIKDTEFEMGNSVNDIPVICDQKDIPGLWEAFEDFVSDNAKIAPDIKVKAAIAKIPFTLKLAKDLGDSQKVIIYSDHVEPVEKIAEELGVKPITGKVPPEKRVELADLFIKGDQRFLVATIGSFTTGINGLTVCNHTIFNDPNWTPGIMKQAKKRTDRIGQEKPCNYHYIFGTKQDEKIYKAIEEKEKVIKEATE